MQTKKKTLLHFLALMLFTMTLSCKKNEQDSNLSPKSTVNSSLRTINPSITSVTCLQVYNQLKGECIDVGGNEGLVNTTTSFTQAWTKFKQASDVNSSTATLVSDVNGNTFYAYVPTSEPIFVQKGYNVVKAIDFSSGPNQPSAPRKLRFTKP